MSTAARMTRTIAALAAAVLAASVLAIVLQSLFVLAGLRGLGAPIGIAASLRFILGDVAGMISTYGIALGPTFLIAFAVAGWLRPHTSVPRAMAFAIAGGTGIVVLLTGDLLYEGHHWIAGSRGWAGMACQFLAGAAGGLVFAGLTRPKTRQAGRATPM